MRRITLIAFGWRTRVTCALSTRGLNAPFGVRCFLTARRRRPHLYPLRVLMHLLVLGAF